ncbi:MAG: hypothetical protein J6Y88_03970 [Bacteroidales bacterium]|nr:hypothetical protein [Bacteroidales bacterium]
MGLKSKFWGNTRKPKGIFGIYMVNRMNRGRHEILAEWALKDLEIDSGSSALDIGLRRRGQHRPPAQTLQESMRRRLFFPVGSEIRQTERRFLRVIATK